MHCKTQIITHKTLSCNCYTKRIYRLNQASRIYLNASKNKVYHVWNKALTACNEINRRDINYSATLGLGNCLGEHSNSVARTLADAMDFPYSRITYSDVGREKNLLLGRCC